MFPVIKAETYRTKAERGLTEGKRNSHLRVWLVVLPFAWFVSGIFRDLVISEGGGARANRKACQNAAACGVGVKESTHRSMRSELGVPAGEAVGDRGG